jgi:retron-type reverse transcriptase
VVILDFSKAFDTVPHDKLMYKLEKYGIKGDLHKWLTSFLTKREMRVDIEGEQSNKAVVESGVPQGTVLGPLLFLCHINDLPECVKSQVRLFADDCLLYHQINSREDHILRFNAKKCYVMSIKGKSSCLCNLDKTVLQQVTENPYLGILLFEDLGW